MNALDRAIMAIAPGWAAKRAGARLRVLSYRNAYDAADRTRLREPARDHGSANTATGDSAYQVRLQARHLGRNHDIVVNGLNVLVQNTIGATGIGVEFQPRNANGDIDEEIVDQLIPLWHDWRRRPEVTWQHDYASMQRLDALTLFRDGESLSQDLIGAVPYLDHGSLVPYSIELIEPDLLPLDYNDRDRNIVQGVECNAWGRPVAYHLYKQHPGDPGVFQPERKRVLADLICHAKMVDRIGQRRGMSILASVLTRLEDLKDYEESERIAAKIAACMAAFIIKGDPTTFDPASMMGSDGRSLPERQMRFQPGMVWDNLRPGESVGTVDTNRPNANLTTWRDGQLRATSGGMRVSFSSLAKNYNGTYSAQRQELVEQYGAYGVLAYEYISKKTRPQVERFVMAAVMSGRVKLRPGTPMQTLTDALYLPPVMPWIDPKKEAEAMALMEENTYMSGPEIIRRRGASPRDVLDQQSQWQRDRERWGIPPSAPSARRPEPAKLPEDPEETNA